MDGGVFGCWENAQKVGFSAESLRRLSHKTRLLLMMIIMMIVMVKTVMMLMMIVVTFTFTIMIMLRMRRMIKR